MSSNTLCPIYQFDLFEDPGLSVAFKASDIVLINQMDPANVAIEVKTIAPFRKTVYVRAMTEPQSGTEVFNSIALTFTVCGNEVVQATPPSQTVFLYEYGDTASIPFTGVFSTSVDESTSHSLCSPLSYSLKKASCSMGLS